MPASTLQIDLDFDRPVALPPPAAPDEVSSLAEYLSGKGWMLARDIIHDNPPGLNLPPNPEAAKRKLRTLAEAGTRAILSFPGSKGYRALREASVEEIEHGVRAHRSQARVHIRRAVALQNFRHGRKLP